MEESDFPSFCDTTEVLEGRCSSIKKPFMPIVIMIISSVIAGILISSAIFAFTGFNFFNGNSQRTVSVDSSANADLTELAYTVLGFIKDGDFNALSGVVHPEQGVIFSPYATINPATDRMYSAEEIATLDSETGTEIWGVRNGSGEPIVMTVAEYFSEFVPAADHINAPVIGVNHIVRSGNALENITDVFPNVKFVDFHMPGGEPAEEFDWTSLRLGFEEYNGELRLIVIVFSKWTV